MKQKFKSNHKFLILLFIFLWSPPLQAAKTFHHYPHSNQLPALERLEEIALKRAGLDPREIKRWQKNVKWAAALPRVQFSWESKLINQNTNIIQDSISVTSSGVAIGPESSRIDEDFEDNQNFEVRAVWALDELLFNRESLSISREARDLYVARLRLKQDLQEAYYQLKAKLTQTEMEPSLLKNPLERLTIEQKIDQINSLTGGEFRRLIHHNPSRTLNKTVGWVEQSETQHLKNNRRKASKLAW